MLAGLPVSSLRSATPLLFALLGECLTQRVGRINLGLEGQMLVGAVAGYGVAAFTGDAWLGLAAGAAAGALLSAVYALLTVAVPANPFASGLAVWMLGYGISAFVGTGLVGMRIDGFAPLEFGLTPTILLALALVPLIGLWLYRTGPGLRWRAVGESPETARAAGIVPWRVVASGIVTGGVLSGLGGAALSVDYTRSWAEGMTAGRGFVAVGLVIVARWNPWLTLPAALLFGVAEAMSLRMQAADNAVPAHLLHTLPYVVSLAVFVVTCVRLGGRHGDGGAPAGLTAALKR
jgi:general nucleoside transport system permease protein